jgi:zinc D-Ala-D-Ala carboxypeptidase
MRNKITCTIIVGALTICALVLAATTSAHSYAATRSVTIATHPATVNPHILHTCPATIQEGSQGEPVVTLQVELNWIFDYKNVDVTGYFGPETDAALRDFQSGAGLPANGIADPTTWHALGEC